MALTVGKDKKRKASLNHRPTRHPRLSLISILVDCSHKDLPFVQLCQNTRTEQKEAEVEPNMLNIHINLELHFSPHPFTFFFLNIDKGSRHYIWTE